MSDKERYKKLIMAALEAQQLKIELRRKLDELAKNLTAYEIYNRCFNNESAVAAIAELRGWDIHINEKKYVKCSAVYKDVDIYLHDNYEKPGRESLKNIIKELSNNEILG